MLAYVLSISSNIQDWKVKVSALPAETVSLVGEPFRGPQLWHV